MLQKIGAKCVSLGKRILRTETAGTIMAGNIFYELEGQIKSKTEKREENGRKHKTGERKKN